MNCPGCGHSLDRDLHTSRHGCVWGWEYDDQGLPTAEGCNCPLVVAEYHA